MTTSYTEVVSFGDTAGQYGYTNYPTLREAHDAVAPGGAVIIAPGTYVVAPADKMSISKKVDVIGFGPSPADVVLSAPIRFESSLRAVDGADSLIENLTLTTENADADNYTLYVQSSLGVDLKLNRCVLKKQPNAYAIVNGNARDFSIPLGGLLFTNCDFLTTTGENTGAYYNGVFRWIDLGYVRLRDCIKQGNVRVSFSTASTSGVQTFGTLLEPGYVESAIAPNGAGNGIFLRRPPLGGKPATGRVVDLSTAGSPRVVVFDWDTPTRGARLPVAADGQWAAEVTPIRFGVYYISREQKNHPVIHGPYTQDDIR